ncbi:MAG: hypothetical protein QXL94_00545 [Candidatus Parvarchaeum sp.]
MLPGVSGAANYPYFAQVISRASSMVDEYVFNTKEGSFCATLTVDARWANRRSSGRLVLPVKGTPLRELVGIAYGLTPENISSVSNPDVGENIILGENEIYIDLLASPFYASTTVSNSYGVGFASRVYAVYSYVTGYPHLLVAGNAVAGESTIDVWCLPGQTQVWGLYPGSVLTIKDPAGIEMVTVSSIAQPSAPNLPATLTLANPLLYDHTGSPNNGYWGSATTTSDTGIFISALPSDIEQAVILLTGILLKSQGFSAQIPLTLSAPAPPRGLATGYPGLSGDWTLVKHLLNPYRVPYIHGVFD